MKTFYGALILCLAGAARADSPEAAFARVDKAKVPTEEARGRIATVVQALTDAGMPRSATVLLAALAGDDQQPAGVREAAKAALASRAADDPGLAELLLSQESDPGKLPPALAVRLARGHLERALQLAPVEEGVAFDNLKAPQGPALQQASGIPAGGVPASGVPASGIPEVKPLDKELAAEMGQPAQEPPADKPEAKAPVDPQPARSAQQELDQARALAASVPAGDALEADAREVAGLSALAAGDDAGAAKEFLALAQLPAGGDGAAIERRDKAYLQLARLAYQGGDDTRATQLYERVGRSGPEWLDALFEASWAHFRKTEDEKALGNLLTLHAPFFQNRFFPESFVLKALVLYQNCRYADARATLLDFEQRYRPLEDGLSATLAKLSTPQGAYEFLARGAVQVQESVPPSAREEVGRVEQEPDLLGATQAAVQLAQEIDSLDRRPQVFRTSALITRLTPRLRQARLSLLESAGRKLLSRLAQERSELRELLGQTLRLSFEIAGREKELAASSSDGLTTTHRDPPRADDDEELWPFQGEYWRDELGSYRYQLGKRCAKPRAAPQTASSPPQQIKAQLAADPKE